MAEKATVDFEKLAQFCAAAADEKLGEDILVLKVKELSSIADYFVMITANSQPHLRALVSFLERQVREKFEVRALSVDGVPESGWVLVDFASVLVHIMTDEARKRYDLERLWNDAPRLAFH